MALRVWSVSAPVTRRPRGLEARRSRKRSCTLAPEAGMRTGARVMATVVSRIQLVSPATTPSSSRALSALGTARALRPLPPLRLRPRPPSRPRRCGATG